MFDLQGINIYLIGMMGAGKSTIGKTMVAIDVGLAISRGVPVLGRLETLGGQVVGQAVTE